MAFIFNYPWPPLQPIHQNGWKSQLNQDFGSVVSVVASALVAVVVVVVVVAHGPSDGSQLLQIY